MANPAQMDLTAAIQRRIELRDEVDRIGQHLNYA
jgi:hypothetical protein